MSFRDYPLQQRIDYLRDRHGKQLKVGFVNYGLGQGIWADWGKKNCNLTEFPSGTVAVIDEKELLEPTDEISDAAVHQMLDWWLDYLDGAVDISNERELP